MKIWTATLVGIALSSGGYCQAVQNARQVAANTFPSVVLLVMEDANGQPLSLGSGFFVGDGLVATNFHVIEGSSGGYAKLVGQKTKFNIAGCVAMDQGHDLVLLSLDDAKAPSLSFGDSSSVAIGDSVYAVGNPEGLEGTFSEGIVSGIRQLDNNSLLQITAPISPGSSGGPVLDVNGRVVGVAVSTYKQGQNLNFAIPATYVNRLIQTKDKLMALAAISTRTGQSTVDDAGGKKITEGVTVKGFTWEGGGLFSLSLVNKLRDSVKNVQLRIVFYNPSGDAIDFSEVQYAGIIPAGLAKRIDGLSVSVSTAMQNNAYVGDRANIDFRVLGFEIEPE